MTQYNQLALSPLEFENLSRDLLQKHLNIYLESFTTGKDGGIDFRASAGHAENCVVQAKRYTNYRPLLAQLKSEAKKVKKIIDHIRHTRDRQDYSGPHPYPLLAVY
jgi:hypothetical protein